MGEVVEISSHHNDSLCLHGHNPVLSSLPALTTSSNRTCALLNRRYYIIQVSKQSWGDNHLAQDYTREIWLALNSDTGPRGPVLTSILLSRPHLKPQMTVRLTGAMAFGLSCYSYFRSAFITTG